MWKIKQKWIKSLLWITWSQKSPNRFLTPSVHQHERFNYNNATSRMKNYMTLSIFECDYQATIRQITWVRIAKAW